MFVYENISVCPMINLLINLRYAPLASSHLNMPSLRCNQDLIILTTSSASQVPIVIGEYNAYKCQIGINELYAQRISKVDPCVTPCYTRNCFCTSIQTNVCRFQCDVYCLLVWRDRVRHLATDPVVMRLCPATGRCALLVNHPK